MAAAALFFLGLLSDTLLLTQFILPLGLALWITAPAPRGQSVRLRAFLKVSVIALGLALLLRLLLQAGQWGSYPSVIRYAPTPAAMAGAGGQMIADLAGPILRAVPLFLAMLVLALAGAWRFGRNQALSVEQRQAAWFASACLVTTLALPVLAVYWRNSQHGRYLLPLLVVPLWWLLTVLPAARLRTPFAAGIVCALLLGAAGMRLPQVDFKAWAWPYPGRVAALDQFLAAEQRTRGLAEYWTASYLGAVSRSGLKLNQVRPDGRVQFWGNNAFHHFDAAAPGGTLHPGRYSFLLANDLDPVALRAKYGTPARTATVGGYDVWLYDEAGAARLSALVDAEVRTFLGNRRGTERIDRGGAR
jgi:hypothetical protein